MNDSGDQSDRETSPTWRSPAIVAGIVVLALFSVLVTYMILQTDTEDERWTRLVFLFGAVEAIVFAAAGAIFGTQVQRARVENAEKRADEHADAAASGKALAKSVKAASRQSTAGGSPPVPGSFAPPGVSSGSRSTELDHLANLADELFPE